jgi:hypothetical protein
MCVLFSFRAVFWRVQRTHTAKKQAESIYMSVVASKEMAQQH